MKRILFITFLVGCTHTIADAEDAAAADEALPIEIPGEVLQTDDELGCTDETENDRAVRLALNRVRELAGVPQLRCDEKIRAAARAHCHYVELNGSFSHVEVRGKQGFTGEHFGDRLTAQHVQQAAGAEVMANLAGAAAIDAAAGWMNSVYHRAPLLRSEMVAFGYGGAEGCTTVDLAKMTLQSPKNVVWPPNGAVHVPTTFYAKYETPNPVKGRDVVGSPITLIAKQSIKHLKAMLTLGNPSAGVAVPVQIITSDDSTGFVHPGEAHIVPLAPLKSNTTYTATFSGDDLREVTTFTTGS
jgi:uncharacterized protein YkwD